MRQAKKNNTHETKSRVDETGRVMRERTRDGEQRGHLSESNHHAVHHRAHETVREPDGDGTAIGERLA